jgi:hypothetical protein
MLFQLEQKNAKNTEKMLAYEQSIYFGDQIPFDNILEKIQNYMDKL